MKIEFKEKNKINLDAEYYEKPIYHYMKYEHLISMIKSRKLVIAKTCKWEDPYENFFFKSNFKHEATTVDAKRLANIIFGQCWTYFRDSDALWRIYSQDKKSVRIKTSPSKLFDTIYTQDSCKATTYIGKVKYMQKKQLIHWLETKSPINVYNINQISVDSYFLKRNNFSHERELRIIYNPGLDSPDSVNEYKEYDIDILNFIEEISFDPRLEKGNTFYKDAKKELRKLGILNEIIKKSSLYKFTPIDMSIE